MARCSEGEGLRAAVVVEAEGVGGGAAGELGLRQIMLDVLLSATALGPASTTTPPVWSASCAMPVRVQGVEGCVEGLGGLRHGEADDGGQARASVQTKQADKAGGRAIPYEHQQRLHAFFWPVEWLCVVWCEGQDWAMPMRRDFFFFFPGPLPRRLSTSPFVSLAFSWHLCATKAGICVALLI